MATPSVHRPVLLQESLDHLSPRPGSVVVDGTLGAGGHAEAILEASAPEGRVIGLDVDPEIRALARERLARFGERLQVIGASYRRLPQVLAELGCSQVDGVLLDLGVSSLQLDRPERGFRFARDTAEATPLDMRMDPALERTAADLLETADEAALAGIFQRYGELPGARRLARAVVARRRESPLRSAADLRQLVAETGVGRGRKHDPATRVFQALRIAVNDELGALSEGIDGAIETLRPGGRLVVIAYHSLEDRLVKQRFRQEEKGCTCPPKVPVCVCGGRVRLRVLTRRPVKASEAEVRENPRARSARLRAAERVAEAA